ncbi:MAG: hypothetical protein CMK06_00225 [Ponticaulis sp.]|nr:hypothetical protein [Ponticaulis sp.]
MGNTPHELVDEFPANADDLHRLKAENPHFARLTDEYHDINRQIHRAETRVEPMSDEYEETLRKRRLQLKDEIAAILRDS